ncbi:phosphoadenosine phosphosulfate reductase [Oxynema aestuarii AP17]|jgi:phosphoadenosine phosphosulfate reductase|uniref:Phosphoadenosine 5'-phosphosulfate reductase n=2 Tax=Oxynema TaxID=1492710 RepID=A0A6H1U4H6_9CYAN|nr:phosphoadenosine phosphosulfate reductase [Oxynema aestuarii AP17]RMH76701.1 MAG: phosphoadenosine phosphosulfate reductase [Cyanobacteria bacterium J007]
MVYTPEAPVATRQQFDIDKLNQQFQFAHPREILAWCIENIPHGLVQSTAFGVSGMVIMDVLYRDLQPQRRVPVLFLDTLHHFQETLDLVEQSRKRYNLDLHVYKALDADSREAFALRYGDELWHRAVDKFHYLTKVEPLERGLKDLDTVAWITGRRRDQSPSRANMGVFEYDKKGRLKVNPLAYWTRNQTWGYVIEHGVPYNVLHDRGYASIGDEPLTTPVAAGEHERAGRWRGSAKMECGIHL